MIAASVSLELLDGRVRLPVGFVSVALILAFAAACWVVTDFQPWVSVWPAAWTIPIITWVGLVMTAFVEVVRPATRLFSGALSVPMHAVNTLLTTSPWLAVLATFVGLSWWIGRWRLALFTTVSLCFILVSGYWLESMSTLSLVVISVPLALSAGICIGILAYIVPWIRNAVEATLDFMQTIPTFAYLTPLLLLFGFGPVVGLIASAIFAVPPIARNTLLGLQLIDPEVKEAAAMAGATWLQSLIFVELPGALSQIMVGVNQCVMACLSMVIIAAVIGGFGDIGWAVLLTMRMAEFGQSLLAGLVIVVFAMLIDRMSAGLADENRRGSKYLTGGIAIGGILVALIFWRYLPSAENMGLFDPAVTKVDEALSQFTTAYGQQLESIKNAAMYFALLPLRIGLDDSVRDFSWGFTWQAFHAVFVFSGAALLAALALWREAPATGSLILLSVYIVVVGVTDIPWPVTILMAGSLAWAAGGMHLVTLVVTTLTVILLSGLWEKAMLSVYLCGAAVIACAAVGGALGLWAAIQPAAWRILRPICDTLQSIPLFVFLIPAVMFFQTGEFSAFLAICAYAIVPMIRYTRHGVSTTPPELVEAARASGASEWQLLFDVRIPYAVPALLLGLNQTILSAFAMLVIAALVGTTELGQAIYLALAQSDIGLGVSAGLAMALLALSADRIVGGLASQRRAALGLQ